MVTVLKKQAKSVTMETWSIMTAVAAPAVLSIAVMVSSKPMKVAMTATGSIETVVLRSASWKDRFAGTVL